jgi:hypothetical protein
MSRVQSLIAESQTPTRNITVRITAAEFESIAACCERVGIKPHAWAAAALRDQLPALIKIAGEIVPANSDVSDDAGE